MKIAHFIPQFYPYVGGAEICVHNVCSKLVKNGHTPVVITTTPPPEHNVDLGYSVEYLWKRSSGLVHRFPFLGKFYLHSCLNRLQKKYQFDLWQITAGVPFGIYAIDFFRKNNIPAILRCCGEDIQKFPEIGYGYRLDAKIDKKVKKAYPLYDGFVALTPTVEKEYNNLSIPDDKIKIIPNGADCKKFADALENNERIAEVRSLYCNENEKLILTTGRYHPKKGFDLVPEIAGILKKSGVQFKWVIAGSGCNRLLEKFPVCRELGIITTENFSKSDGELFSLPPISLVELYAAADIYVLPTLIETFGMVLVEAMAAGLPIVTTDAPGVCDVVEEGITGIKTPIKDVDKMADKIIEVLNDSALYQSLSHNAIARSEIVYDWNVVTQKYMDFYKCVIEAKSVINFRK